MKNIFIVLIASLIVFCSLVHDAEAKRLGGGSSFGMQRQNVAPRPATPSQASPTAPPSAPPASVPNRSGIGGMLGGLALGAGIGALLGHFGMGGMGGGFFTILLLVGALLLIARMFSNRAAQPQYASPLNAPNPVLYQPASPPAAGIAAPNASVNVPTDFDTEGFLRQAKLTFVRLQAANDAGNMEDIKTFSTPEFYAEIEMQFLERGKTKQQTDIMQLNAELIDVCREDKRRIASVRFSGQLRETVDAAPEAFSELWNLIKPVDGSSWVVAGIQQS